MGNTNNTNPRGTFKLYEVRMDVMGYGAKTVQLNAVSEVDACAEARIRYSKWTITGVRKAGTTNFYKAR